MNSVRVVYVCSGSVTSQLVTVTDHDNYGGFVQTQFLNFEIQFVLHFLKFSILRGANYGAGDECVCNCAHVEPAVYCRSDVMISLLRRYFYENQMSGTIPPLSSLTVLRYM